MWPAFSHQGFGVIRQDLLIRRIQDVRDRRASGKVPILGFGLLDGQGAINPYGAQKERSSGSQRDPMFNFKPVA